MSLTYAQQIVAIRELKALGHGDAIKAYRKGNLGNSRDDYGSMRYGVYSFNGPEKQAKEAAHLFGLLGYEVLVDTDEHDDGRSIERDYSNFRTNEDELFLHFKVEEPGLPRS